MNIGLSIYDDAVVADFYGPFEVFSSAKRLAHGDWSVFSVAEAMALAEKTASRIEYHWGKQR